MAFIIGTSGKDTLTGTSFNDIIYGLGGDDFIDGGAGRDIMSGGAGNDTYVVNQSDDVVLESNNQGVDTILSFATFELPVDVENLVLQGTSGIRGVGNNLNNTIIGNTGNNSLQGGTGDDTLDGGLGDDKLAGGLDDDVLIGGAGNDTLFGGDPGEADTLIGGTGNDVYSFRDGNTIVELPGEGIDKINFVDGGPFTLADNVEIGNAISGGDFAITGNASDNQLFGQTGNDTLSGLDGVDTLTGRGGNDTYFVEDENDVVFESAGQGIDIVNAGASYTLIAGQEIEVLQLTGTDGINALGNEFGNTLIGNSGNNVLGGLQGDDLLTGLAGNDVFQYAIGGGHDQILDFTGAGFALNDVIQLAGTGLINLGQLLPLISDVAGGCQIVFNSADSIFVAGVSKAQWDATDFSFS
jgi:Ca2+-binding RTX toxin-like protein